MLNPTHFTFRATRSSGPGGQHVNTSSTAISAGWNPVDDSSLSADQVERIRHVLASRCDSEGRVWVRSQNHRSQLQNKHAAIARLEKLVASALYEEVVRVPTAPSLASRVERRVDKEHIRKQKTQRRWRLGGDE